MSFPTQTAFQPYLSQARVMVDNPFICNIMGIPEIAIYGPREGDFGLLPF
jgi:hypothetical protein